MNHKYTLESKTGTNDTGGPYPEFPDVKKIQTDFVDSELFIKQAFDTDPVRGYELLFKRYYKQLCSHAVRFVYARDVAEDIVVEVFSQFWSKQLHTSVTTSFRAYLFTTVRHAAFHYMRRNFGKEAVTGELEDLHLATPESSPQQELQFQELVLKIEQVIRSLSRQNQKVFLMSRFEGKRNAAIAEELGISVKTVEGHITKGLAVLRKALQDHGLLSLIQILLLFI
ncbi:RNA polymerase sigma-70 factor [Dyadobacter sp. 676]|uniref:RNA polymerase sigma-70 factor n=1 Tax=Dyadobacter sp. 676 TaxID=3088362 RepID=A0AAU8FJ88_9BACT